MFPRRAARMCVPEELKWVTFLTVSRWKAFSLGLSWNDTQPQMELWRSNLASALNLSHPGAWWAPSQVTVRNVSMASEDANHQHQRQTQWWAEFWMKTTKDNSNKGQEIHCWVLVEEQKLMHKPTLLAGPLRFQTSPHLLSWNPNSKLICLDSKSSVRMDFSPSS